MLCMADIIFAPCETLSGQSEARKREAAIKRLTREQKLDLISRF